MTQARAESLQKAENLNASEFRDLGSHAPDAYQTILDYINSPGISPSTFDAILKAMRPYAQHRRPEDLQYLWETAAGAVLAGAEDIQQRLLQAAKGAYFFHHQSEYNGFAPVIRSLIERNKKNTDISFNEFETLWALAKQFNSHFPTLGSRAQDELPAFLGQHLQVIAGNEALKKHILASSGLYSSASSEKREYLFAISRYLTAEKGYTAEQCTRLAEYGESKLSIIWEFLVHDCHRALQDPVVDFILNQPRQEQKQLVELASSLYRDEDDWHTVHQHFHLSRILEHDNANNRRLLIKLLSSRSMESISNTVNRSLDEVYNCYVEKTKSILEHPEEKRSGGQRRLGLGRLQDLSIKQRQALQQLAEEVQSVRGFIRVQSFRHIEQGFLLTKKLKDYSSSFHHKSRSRVKQSQAIQRSLKGLSNDSNYMAVIKTLHAHKINCIKDDLRKNTKRSLFNKMNRKGSSRLYETLNEMQCIVSDGLWARADSEDIRAYEVFCQEEFQQLVDLLKRHCQVDGKGKKYGELIKCLEETTADGRLTKENVGGVLQAIRSTKLPGHLKAVSKELEQRAEALIKYLNDSSNLSLNMGF